MAKQDIDVGTVANDGTGDPIRTAMTKVNENTNELYTALGGNTVTNLVNTSAEIELLNTSNKISFLYDTEAELLAVDPATHHGCIGHAHDTGALYYAHGAWRKLLSDNSAGNITSYVDSLAGLAYTGNAISESNDLTGGTGTLDQVLRSNGNGTFSFVDNTGGGGGSQNVFSTIQVSGQNDVVADSTTDTLTFVAGTNVTITTDSNNDSITINASGGGGGTSFSALTEVDTANLDVDDIALQAVTNLVVTGPDSSRYLIDQYPGDNPTVYVSRGQTIAFNLDGVTASHPFRILDIGGGSQYNTGLVHVALDGTTTTGSGAQDKINGTLYWKIPGNAPAGTYEYICTAHSAMNGNIVVADPAASGGGSGLQSRATINGATSSSHANNGLEDLNLTGYKSYALLKIATDRAAWVRLYITDAKRQDSAERNRLSTSDPAPDAGVIAEVITSGATTVNVTPGIIGWNGDGTPSTTIYALVTNLSGSTSAVDVTLTALQLES